MRKDGRVNLVDLGGFCDTYDIARISIGRCNREARHELCVWCIAYGGDDAYIHQSDARTRCA
jgi:hypothetical protein